MSTAEANPNEVSPNEVSPNEVSPNEAGSNPSAPTVSELGQEGSSFTEMLQNLETNVAKLKARYAQVQQDQTRQIELQARQAVLKTADWSSDSLANAPADRQTDDRQTELENLETELRALELRLESELFSWDSWKQYFWQTVRFVGLGMAIGWGMAFYVMKHPVPHAIEPNRPEQVR
jgi:hypothetical protein